MGVSKDYPNVPDWVSKSEGYQTGAMVKYKGNIFYASFWASEPGVGDANHNGWRFYDELYDQTPHTPTQQAKIIAYIPTWRKKEGFNYANGEMYQYITHGIVAFLMFSEKNLGEFDLTSVNDVNAVLSHIVNTAHQNSTKISIALGGATDYGFLNLMTSVGNNSANPLLDKAVQNVVNFVKSNDLDGVDLDLECWWDKNSDASKDQGGRPKSKGPHPAGYALTLFAQKLKKAMPDKLVSATLFGTSWYGNNYDSKIANYVDWLAIMTYDLTGSWNASPVGPHSALFKIRNQDSAKIRNQEFYQESYTKEQQGEWPGGGITNNPILSVEDTLWYWTNPLFVNWQGSGQNIPRNKIAAGVPIYGYDFAYGKDRDDLSGQIAPGYKNIRYKDIIKQFPNAHTAANGNIKVPGNTPRPPFVSAAGTYPYAHNIYLETPKTATDKLNFLKSVGAQGVIIWELTDDVWENGKSIAKALYQNSGNPPKQPVEPPLPSNWSPNNWLASIPGSKKLSELTIPGTHDSCTYTLSPSYILTPITQTQHLTLEQQLNAGIRFLDIRCRHINNAFAIHHGSVYLELNFDDVLKVCTTFLTENRNECIVMSVKHEYDDGNGVTRSFEATFDSYLQGNSKDFWYLGDNIPNLKDVRGKIVLLRRFGLDDRANRAGTKGIDASSWADNATFDIKNKVHLKIQDKYVVDTILPVDIDDKWNSIKSLLDQAKSDASDTWFINFSSGASTQAYPNAVAGRINYRIFDYIGDSPKFANRLGTLVVDFPDDEGKTELVNRIIKVNFSVKQSII